MTQSYKDTIQEIESIRSNLIDVRSKINDLNTKTKNHSFTHIAESTTTLIHLLHTINNDIIDNEKSKEDKTMSPGIYFCSRGIGLDIGNCCFICGKKESNYCA